MRWDTVRLQGNRFGMVYAAAPKVTLRERRSSSGRPRDRRDGPALSGEASESVGTPRAGGLRRQATTAGPALCAARAALISSIFRP
ncbi:hypothetical protein GCM10010495_18590 [Kitasatospora herbaricolor]|nr:hypothetical protein GCM10010495_18590 [Kitasatospora herbaricolor]